MLFRSVPQARFTRFSRGLVPTDSICANRLRRWLDFPPPPTVKYINEQIKNGTAEFAVVMCDLNYLKHINDNLGHKAGDEAIRKAANMLCKVFPMSTVFRIGGDEFVVIPSILEYAIIDEKQNLLKMMLSEQKKSSDNYLERISIAFGCAVFDRKKDHSYQEVFERADHIMYEDKRKIHESDGISTER